MSHNSFCTCTGGPVLELSNTLLIEQKAPSLTHAIHWWQWLDLLFTKLYIIQYI
jgi:hypothetical protein